ncbi:uncharacterized protein LOC127083318 [Lathyrus oleraceus]|uniref:uncharacterized protein LOC127083318 n=1 Tax=Pisum sativum TaxID=3888 RepID=UPI0021CEF683|nr:uncharacterized protein LOC127083318 [Pisum sativum]
MCRRFIWAGNDEKSKRAPVAWDHVCDSIANGGRNIIALGEWNKATIGKLLWSLSEKKDKMWVKWMHSYYLKNGGMEVYQPNSNSSWLMKSICKHKAELMSNDIWVEFQANDMYSTRRMYQHLRGDKPRVDWRRLMYTNMARPRAVFTLWLENRGHLFFECAFTKKTWKEILNRLGLGYIHIDWIENTAWQQAKGKGNKMRIFKAALAETVYHIWWVRNRICFQQGRKEELQSQHVHDILMGRFRMNRKLTAYCNSL